MATAQQQVTSMTTAVALRSLAWPELPRVDLTRELPWLVHDSESTSGIEPCRYSNLYEAGVTRNDTPVAANSEDSPHSPYAQQLQRRRDTRAPLSPAQRAAKRILQLELELGCVGTSAANTYRPHDDIDRFDSLQREVLDVSRLDTCAIKPPRGTGSKVSQSNIKAKRAPSVDAPSAAVAVPGRKSNAASNRRRVTDTTSALSASTSDATQRLSIRLNTAVATAHKQPRDTLPQMRRKKQRQRSQDAKAKHELHDKQLQLAQWLTEDACSDTSKREALDAHVAYSLEVAARIESSMAANRGDGLWHDQVASRIAREMTSESVFGGFIPTRRLAFCPAGDNVDALAASSSRLGATAAVATSATLSLHQHSMNESTSCPEDARTITSTSVYNTVEATAAVTESDQDGGATEHEMASTDTVDSLIHERAVEIRTEAQSLACAGNVVDALAVLQDGIRQLLVDFQDNQDELRERGFDYSEDVHARATCLQLAYRARHRVRVAKSCVLQRMWRACQTRRARSHTREYRAANAAVIQRHYKLRYQRIRRQRAVMHIQRCFRTFKEQRLLVAWRRACRLVLDDARRTRELLRLRRERRRRLWTKLNAMLTARRLWQSRFDAVARIQCHWRGMRVRKTYAELIDARCEAEQQRRSCEDQFIADRLKRAMKLYRSFLTTTRAGDALVRWQMHKPWLRFERLRSDGWHDNNELGERIRALYGVTFSWHHHGIAAWLLRVYGHVLAVDSVRVSAICNPLEDASSDALLALYSSCDAPRSSLMDATPVLPSYSKRSRLQAWLWKRQQTSLRWCYNAQLAASRALLLLCWYALLWPFSLLVVRYSQQNRQRALGVLEQQQRDALVKHLRHTYRLLGRNRHDSSAVAAINSPLSLVCRFCLEAFATASAYTAHTRTCKLHHAAQCAEWSAIECDIVYADRQRRWTTHCGSNRNHKRPTCPSDPQAHLALAAFTLKQAVDVAVSMRHAATSSCLPRRLSSRLGTAAWRRICSWRRSCTRSLQLLIDMAVCCGVSDVDDSANEYLGGNGSSTVDHSTDASASRHVALELLALLLLALGLDGLHPLAVPQLYTFVEWSVPAPSPVIATRASTSTPVEIDRCAWVSELELRTQLQLANLRSISSVNDTHDGVEALFKGGSTVVAGANRNDIEDVEIENKIGSTLLGRFAATAKQKSIRLWHRATIWRVSARYHPSTSSSSATVLPVA